MDIIFELKAFTHIVLMAPVRWYKKCRKEYLVATLLRTQDGRHRLAEAMIGPIPRAKKSC